MVHSALFFLEYLSGHQTNLSFISQTTFAITFPVPANKSNYYHIFKCSYWVYYESAGIYLDVLLLFSMHKQYRHKINGKTANLLLRILWFAIKVSQESDIFPLAQDVIILPSFPNFYIGFLFHMVPVFALTHGEYKNFINSLPCHAVCQ